MSAFQLAPMKGRVAIRHDCGASGRLTARQIAAVAGVREQAIYSRLRAGIRGEELLAKPDRKKSRELATQQYRGREIRTSGCIGIAVACTIARKFGSRAPTVEQLRQLFDMSRATAFRWRRAWLDANGVDA